GGRYSDEWHRIHLLNPRDVVPESNMPGFPWLAERTLDGERVQKKMRALRKLGHPYTDEAIAAAPDAVAGRSEMDALIAYMQGLKFRGAPTTDEKPAAESRDIQTLGHTASPGASTDSQQGQP